MIEPIEIGIDEAGRGPWTGSVFAAAVVLDPLRPIAGLKDSKKLSPLHRAQLSQDIMQRALYWGVAQASAQEIDQYNILQATFLAMRRALGMAQIPSSQLQRCIAYVDGNRDPGLDMPTCLLVKGDSLMPAISAASILAKVARDEQAHEMHLKYPNYGFDRHKGYGTALHAENLTKLGALPEHRRSFAPVARWYLAQTA